MGTSQFKTFRAIARLAMAFLALSSIGAQAALVSNGSFESGNLSGWTLQSGAADVRTDYGATDGTHAAILGFGNLNGPNFRLTQSIATTAGTQYRVSFDWGPSPNRLPQSMMFSVDGTAADIAVLNLSGTGTFPTPFAHQTIDFVADSALTTLEFLDTSANSNIIDQALDNVVMVELGDPNRVPEPGSVALLGLGLVGLAVARRRSA